MGELVNLRQVKKARAKRVAEAQADANRLLHGRGKAEKQLEALLRRKTETVLDQARLDQERLDPAQ